MSRRQCLASKFVLGVSALAIVVSPLTAMAQQAAPSAARTAAAQAQAELNDWYAANVDTEDMLRIPMRDGVRLSARIYFPKNSTRKDLPTILWFWPYNIGRSMTAENKFFLEHGYAIAYVNVRGRYFSEGTFTYMGGSGKDGHDTVEWLGTQDWSNGKVGTLGCSSSAEEQHKLSASAPTHLAAAVPRSSGAGLGRVGPYAEEGNLFRGGIPVSLWFSWFHSSGYKYFPHYSPDLTREQMLAIRANGDLEPNLKTQPDYAKEILHLPISEIPKNIKSPPSDWQTVMGWSMGDKRWRDFDFGNDDDHNSVPTLYFNAWYDQSTGPNLAQFENQTRNAQTQLARDNTFMAIAPTPHCQMGKIETEHTVVGERDMGDARFGYQDFLLRWFDHWLKGVDNNVTTEPKVRIYNMGANLWRAYDSWPIKAARTVTYYLDSNGKANTRNGDGRLVLSKPGKASQDSWTYDPLKPTPGVGGQFCCFAAVKAGSFDQSEVENRPDVMVYTSDALKVDTDVTGKVIVSVNLSSDVKDTDLIATLIDVAPDGKAYNLDTQALRVRYRDGWDQEVMMEKGKVYKVTLPPLVTSNTFKTGHKIRVAIQSSFFPALTRNLNTGGPNYNEKDPITAHNTIHHGGAYLSSITIPVVPQPTSKAAAKIAAAATAKIASR
jgi:putative CocE/NonD family hydrolase